MLINCPRCGFSQPKDQYCAQCGVDMDAFKPKEIPLLIQIVKSTTTHIILLLAAALLAGQFIIHRIEPQRWVQKINRFQGVNKSKAIFKNEGTASDQVDEIQQSSEQLAAMRNKEIVVAANTEQPIEANQMAQSAQASAGGTNAAARISGASSADTTRENNPSASLFRVLYAEVSVEQISKWINDSSSAGLYQNMQEYSAGIIPDFRKKLDSNLQILKTIEKKLSPTQSDSNFFGTVNESGNQILGLNSTIEYKSNEDGVIHGTVNIIRQNHQQRENFPAEFDLPKSSVFFILGVLKPQSFINEQVNLNMPPFQVFKSNLFMTHKTEFVIIIEPE